MSKPIALFDLDGTLADFDMAMRLGMERLAAPGEQAYYDNQDDEPEHITNRRRLIKREPGFWANLPRFELGWHVYHMAMDLDYRAMVLTKAPASIHTAWSEKKQWCDRWLPEVPVCLSPDKATVYGRVLVDDWIPYVEAWLEHRPRGLVIMPGHPRNKHFKHPQVVRYDGTNPTEVRERLVAARVRDNEE